MAPLETCIAEWGRFLHIQNSKRSKTLLCTLVRYIGCVYSKCARKIVLETNFFFTHGGPFKTNWGENLLWRWDRLRALLPTSAWKRLSNSSSLSVRIQLVQPLRQTGNTEVSIIIAERLRVRGIGSRSVAREGSKCCMYMYMYIYIYYIYVCMSATLLECN